MTILLLLAILWAASNVVLVMTLRRTKRARTRDSGRALRGAAGLRG